jgi:hypothetical protein
MAFILPGGCWHALPLPQKLPETAWLPGRILLYLLWLQMLGTCGWPGTLPQVDLGRGGRRVTFKRL